MHTDTDTVSRNGTMGRVYGGDPDLLHFRDGTRKDAGRRVADFIDDDMRRINNTDGDTPLCPGCYMIALLNAAICLAQDNGQPLSELGRSMAHAFSLLSDDADAAMTEEILVILDPH